MIPGSYPAGGRGCLSIVRVVCCRVEVSASGRSLAQGSPTEYDRDASTVGRPWRALVRKGLRVSAEVDSRDFHIPVIRSDDG